MGNEPLEATETYDDAIRMLENHSKQLFGLAELYENHLQGRILAELSKRYFLAAEFLKCHRIPGPPKEEQLETARSQGDVEGTR